MNNTLDVTKTLDLQELEIDTFEVEELSGLDVDASAASGDTITISLCSSSSTCSSSCG